MDLVRALLFVGSYAAVTEDSDLSAAGTESGGVFVANLTEGIHYNGASTFPELMAAVWKQRHWIYLFR